MNQTAFKSLLKLVLLVLVLSVVGVGIVKAQETSSDNLTKKYGVTFPVSALGGCQNFGECRTFCEDPVNTVACVKFAKEKGFYLEDPVVSNKDKVLGLAKQDLGCTNETECK